MDNRKIFFSFSLVLLNNNMRQYNAQDIESMFNEHEKHVSHVIVAHTNHRPYVASQRFGKYKNVRADKYLKDKLVETSKDLRYALNCFEKLLYPSATNKPLRRPDLYKPLTFVTLEGANETTDRAQTIHVNIALGNLPTVLTTDDIETLFRHVWHDKAHQSINVKAIEYYNDGESRWNGYSLKEAQQDTRKAWETNGIWDVTNCWIPHAAFNED